MPLTAALVGNPNCGKTTLFNALTGSDRHVGNWSGVTVDETEGWVTGGKFKIVDLPGIYSLSPYSPEEKVTLEIILKRQPDVIINIIDGTNPERNLILTLQLMELEIPMVLAVNMADELERQGGKIDVEKLTEILGCRVVLISARKGENLSLLTEAVTKSASEKKLPETIRYPSKIRRASENISAILAENGEKVPKSGFFAKKILEKDWNVHKMLKLSADQEKRIREVIARFESEGTDSGEALAGARIEVIRNIISQTVTFGLKKHSSAVTTERIDRLLLNKLLAFPIFFLILMGIFAVTFGRVGKFLSQCLGEFISGVIVPAAENFFDSAGSPLWTRSLIIDGVIGGVGGVLSFIPQIAILFFFISILEDSGYMARAAFIADKPLSRIGLSGKSFIPMMMGFGCTTPAVMASRTQEDPKERLLTILLVPFMSCGARLPIYVLFASAFFPAHQSAVILSMYLIGAAVAGIVGIILKKTYFRNNASNFIMEMPPYRFPDPVTVIRSSIEKVKDFVTKAGTIILAMSVVIWVLQSFTPELRFTSDSSESLFSWIGEKIAPLLSPLGFGRWEAAAALLAGFIAKEAVVSTLLVLFSAADEISLGTALTGVFTPLSAFSFMVFCLLYVPCVSAFATIKKETGSLKWALASAGIQLCAAYSVSFAVYNLGKLLGG